MIYRILTTNSPLNLFFLFILTLIFYLSSVNLSDSVIFLALGLFVFFVTVFLLQRIGIFLEFKPGQDYLPIYTFLFFSSISFYDFSLTVSLFFAILGLFFLISIISGNIQPRSTDIAQISLFFALSCVFNKYFIVFLPFMLLVIIFYFPNPKNLAITLLIYIVVAYLIFAYFFLLKKYPLHQIGSLIKFDKLNFDIFSKRITFWVVEAVFLLFSYVYLSINFFKLPIRQRKSFIILSLFFISSLLITPFTKNVALQTIPASFLISYFFINYKARNWIKDLLLLSIIIANFLILFKTI